jgi:hypothetical protein
VHAKKKRASNLTMILLAFSSDRSETVEFTLLNKQVSCRSCSAQPVLERRDPETCRHAAPRPVGQGGAADRYRFAIRRPLLPSRSKGRLTSKAGAWTTPRESASISCAPNTRAGVRPRIFAAPTPVCGVAPPRQSISIGWPSTARPPPTRRRGDQTSRVILS